MALAPAVLEKFYSKPSEAVFRRFCRANFGSEAASDVISGKFVRLAVADKCVKSGYSCLNGSGEIQPKAVGCGIFSRFAVLSELV